MAWNLESSSDVTEELAERRPSYAAFWQDVHGQEKAMRDTQTRLAEEVHDRIRDGIIVTRAHIGSVEIRRYWVSPPNLWARSGKRETFYRIKDFLHEDTGIFEYIALSVSACEVWVKQDSSVEKSAGEKEDERTSESDSSVSEGNENRGGPNVRVIPIESRCEL
ncbi:hypothetical protein F4782DRAFT_549854 [Xylaria castorea]|nr:hypothetical protein F4782DRAFT_549854 [Xylaria castorea]